MRVHGLEGLRVVDASAMRYVTNGNIYAPVMMLAEKSADLILGNTPLEPIQLEFYRHRGGASSGPAEASPAVEMPAPGLARTAASTQDESEAPAPTVSLTQSDD
jgi:hypothetical protein